MLKYYIYRADIYLFRESSLFTQIYFFVNSLAFFVGH
jgi:hypothetical protein